MQRLLDLVDTALDGAVEDKTDEEGFHLLCRTLELTSQIGQTDDGRVAVDYLDEHIAAQALEQLVQVLAKEPVGQQLGLVFCAGLGKERRVVEAVLLWRVLLKAPMSSAR